MSSITVILQPDADGTLHLPLPAAWHHQLIKVTAELEPMAPVAGDEKPSHGNGLQGFGCLRGKIWMAPDFDEPLDDFKDYSA